MAAAPAQRELSKKLGRTLKKARQNASKAIFDTERIQKLQAEVRAKDVEVNKAAAKVRKAKRELKKIPKLPPKTFFQKLLSGGRGGGGGGGVGGFEFDKATGKIKRRQTIF